MAPAVVDELEAVEVEERHSNEARVPFGPSQGLADAVAEEPPVGQGGELVVQGLALEALLGNLPLGHVAGDTFHGEDAAVLVSDQAQPLLDPDRGAALAPDQQLPCAIEVGVLELP